MCVHILYLSEVTTVWTWVEVYVLDDSARSTGALSNGFHADSGVQQKDLTVISCLVEAKELVLGIKKWRILNVSFVRVHMS